MDAVRFQARFLVVSPSRILHPGQLVVRHGRIVEVTDSISSRADIDFGDAAIMPGLINAHTHLEFSSLEQPLPAGDSFPQWISQVVQFRRARQTAAVPVEGGFERLMATTIQRGLQESFLSGAAVVGDIVTQPWQMNWLPSVDDFCEAVSKTTSLRGACKHGLSKSRWAAHVRPNAFPRVFAFPELIGLQLQRAQESIEWANAHHKMKRAEILIALGLSPHASYSTYLPCVQAELARSGAPRRLLAMHLAESQDELEWLATGTGAFRDAFIKLGVPVEQPATSIDQCIELLSQRPSLLVHGNYLSLQQIERVGAARSLTVVYCPRTHAHFGHAPYPLRALREAGARVVFATDSRASNPDLSLWDELVTVRQNSDFLSDAELLNSVTLAAAEALGIEKDWGSLEPGKLASAVVMPTRQDWTNEDLLSRLTQLTTAQLQMLPLSGLIEF